MDSLVVNHHGSYMPKVAQDICSCAAVIYCKITQRYATCTWEEKTSRATADNYRAEILGDILAQLLVKVAAGTKHASKCMRARASGVTTRSWYLTGTTLIGKKDGQAQSDAIRLFQKLIPPPEQQLAFIMFMAIWMKYSATISFRTIK